MNASQDDEVAKKVAAKIVGLLDQSTREIDGITATRLETARKEALAHFQEKPAHVWAPQSAGAGGGLGRELGRFVEPFTHNLRIGFTLLAVVAFLAVAVAWQTFGQQGSDIADIDQALLTDELPINAYLDKGFDSWLKRP